MNWRIKLSALLLGCCTGLIINVYGQTKNNDTSQTLSDKTEKKEPLEFSHPLITESISPDTKIRFTYLNTKSDSGISSQIYDLELEYAPVPYFSLHLDIPYGVLKPDATSSFSNLDNVELALKFANFALAKHNILLGYGIGFEFPTGNDSKGIGSDHILNVDPFLNGGYRWRRWEWTAYFTFGVPVHQNKGEAIPSTLESRATALFHLSRYWQLVGEFGKETNISQNNFNGYKNYDLLEGFKYLPFGHEPWILGAGVREALGKNSDLHFQWLLTIFYHFRD